jgi:hypothetical protein
MVESYNETKKVYLTADNIKKLSDKDMDILKKQGKVTRCPDYKPQNDKIIS